MKKKWKKWKKNEKKEEKWRKIKKNEEKNEEKQWKNEEKKWKKERKKEKKTCYGVSLWWMEAWVTRPERPKGVKDEVKQARGAKSRPEGPPARSRAPEGP